MIKGLSDYDADDLHDLNKKRNNVVIVIDDLMEEAKGSKLLSKLFTQGRHRNVSVILILQNAFPKGKYNTEISRNAMYMVMFLSPADREQINRVGQRMFTNNNDIFMDIYQQGVKTTFWCEIGKIFGSLIYFCLLNHAASVQLSRRAAFT